MPEPATLIIGGLALYAILKQGQAPLAALPAANQDAALSAGDPAGVLSTQVPLTRTPSGAMTTNGSIIAAEHGISLGQVMLAPPIASDGVAVPSDLVAALDAHTALMFRAYAALNPRDFESFLARYADRLVLRNDLMIELLTDPPAQGFEVTPGMLVGMGNAAYKVVQAINGVAVGKSVDLFGVASSAAGAIPGLNTDFVASLQGMAMGYRAINSLNQVMTLASTKGVSVMNFSGMVAVGAYPGLAALPLTGVLMAVGLVVDIAFTIIGDKPDLQKAIDVALDVASLAVLFIPVIGVVIAIIIQLVKFIIDMFGSELFGGGMSHEQREMLEAARYGENLNPMFPQLANCYTPRELFRTIIAWGSGYCGGTHVVAMGVSLILKPGDHLRIGGQSYTVPTDLLLSFGDNETAGGGAGRPGEENPPYTGRCSWLQGSPFAAMSNDEQAIALGVYASVNGVIASAAVGIAEWRKDQFTTPTENLIMARTQPMREFIVTHRLSLDQIDQIALEYRAQPHLNALSLAFGWPTWQEFFASIVDDEWHTFNLTVSEGSLSDFARRNGHPTMYAFRAAALAPWEQPYTRLHAMIAASAAMEQHSWFPTWYANAVNTAPVQVPEDVLVTPQIAAALETINPGLLAYAVVSEPVAAQTINTWVEQGMDPGEAVMTAQWFANQSTP